MLSKPHIYESPMDQYIVLRSELLALNNEVAQLLKQGENVLNISEAIFTQWNHACTAMKQHLMDHVVRVAVVGAIKSGKSTLVNAWLGSDHLKRGAGVVTSMVTRVRKGEQLRARLFMKSWDEVNDEIQQALVLFPTDQWQREAKPFDIRRIQDRVDLAAALDTLDADLRLSQDQLNANSVLLSSYLKGYDQVAGLVGADSTIQEFDARRFSEHRTFVGNDAMAVYLKDIELEVVNENMAGNIEIADCQGSDSPNPLHMAMIQDYLLKAHLIIYVISSRTGVRQADIRFLSMIKKMGIGGNMLFVCNCDLNEHADLDDMQQLIERVKADIQLVLPSPEIFSFSALYNLFGELKTALDTRDKDRLTQWRKLKDLVSFSNEETLRLETFLKNKLSRERASLLLHNQLERLNVMTSGLKQWIRLNRDLMRRDAGDAREMAVRIQENQKHLHQVGSMIQSTLEGATQKIKKELRQNVDSFFDIHSGTVLGSTISFIRSHEIDLHRFRETLTGSGFTQTLYAVFQTFRQDVDAYLTQKINPEIMGFIGQQEAYIKSYLKSVAEPYVTMVQNALVQFEEALTQLNLEVGADKWSLDLTPDLERIKQIVGLSVPPAAASMRYSAHIKTDAVLRLGFYALLRVVRKALKKPLEGDAAEQFKALQDGVQRMKKEMERSIIAHFKDYQENIKFQYVLRLADLTSRQLYEILTDNFQTYAADLKNLLDSISGKRIDKEKVDSALEAIEKNVVEIKAHITVLRERVNQLNVHSPVAVLPANGVEDT
jgi:GTPase SAR1 family protein